MTCVMKGMQDIKKLQNNGDEVTLIVIHNNVNEVESWLETYADGIDIYVIDSEQVYKYIKSPYLPIIIYIERGKIENFRFITY